MRIMSPGQVGLHLSCPLRSRQEKAEIDCKHRLDGIPSCRDYGARSRPLVPGIGHSIGGRKRHEPGSTPSGRAITTRGFLTHIAGAG